MSEGLPRAIRSFVLRQGRVSKAQRRALDTLMPRYGLPYRPQALDLQVIFGRVAPRVLEIGCGMGETTVAIAAQNPQIDYLGIEVHSPGVGSLLKLAAEQGLTNLRVIQHDAVEVTRDMIAPASLAGCNIFFPDPWPKLRHHKRRLIQPGFVALLASRMQAGALLHVATDWENYAAHILDVLSASPELRNLAEDYIQRPDLRPQTKFEMRGLKLGHNVWDLMFERRSWQPIGRPAMDAS
jgi:tRNA (guanine-N7-)-methyltransferase